MQRVEPPTPENLNAALNAVRQFDRHDSILVQRGVRWPALLCEDGVERAAYWRVLGCLGDLFVFWWSPQGSTNGRPSYRAVTSGEMRRYHLQPLLAYAQALADLSGLDWFSTELCLSEGTEQSRYSVIGADGRERPVVAIDYLNDQCDLDVQSRVPGWTAGFVCAPHGNAVRGRSITPAAETTASDVTYIFASCLIAGCTTHFMGPIGPIGPMKMSRYMG